jgi:hypothetical protein
MGEIGNENVTVEEIGRQKLDTVRGEGHMRTNAFLPIAKGKTGIAMDLDGI